MSEMTMMNPAQMEEVTCGMTDGRLNPAESQFLTLFVKIAKKEGRTMEEYLESFRHYNKNREIGEAVEQYVRTFWDRM